MSVKLNREYASAHAAFECCRKKAGATNKTELSYQDRSFLVLQTIMFNICNQYRNSIYSFLKRSDLKKYKELSCVVFQLNLTFIVTW